MTQQVSKTLKKSKGQKPKVRVIQGKSKRRSQELRKKLSTIMNGHKSISVANIRIHFSNLGKTGEMLGLRKRELRRLEISGQRLILFFERLQKYRGVRYAIKEIKAIYREAVNIAMGYDPVTMTSSWYRRDKTNLFPISLKSFVPLLHHRNIVMRRFALSLLNFTTVIELKPIEDISTLVTPSQGVAGLSLIEAPFKIFLRSSQFSQKIKRTWKLKLENHRDNSVGMGLHSTAKAGIKGPTCATAGLQTQGISPELEDMLSEFDEYFRDDHWGHYFKEAKKYFKQIGDPILYDWRKNRNKKSRPLNLSLKDLQLFKKYQGKIGFLSAPAGKTRIVGIGNYWVQEAFLQLHKVLYSVLRTIPEDGTYDQESQFDRVNAAAAIGPVWSFDLTAATDRFPIEFQIKVLNNFEEGLGDLWGRINHALTFICAQKPLKYTVGQPMGLYGSWATFALSHHYLIQFAARQVGEAFPFREYSVLGDDVAIWNRKVALKYKELLLSLDVKISKLKSFVPKPGDTGPCSAEFAKRLTFKGEEMTPISLVMNSEAWSNPTMFPELLHWLKTRRYHSINRVPMSRLLRLLDIRDVNDRNNFVCQLYINGIMTKSPIKGIKDHLPKPEKASWMKLDALEIMRKRLELVVKNGPEKYLSPERLIAERLRLDKAWSAKTGGVFKQMPSNYYLREMRHKQQMDMFDLWSKITKLQKMDYTSEATLRNSPGFAELGFNNILEVYQRFEYVPEVSYDNLYANILNTKPLNELRCEYITKLAKFVKKGLVKQTVP